MQLDSNLIFNIMVAIVLLGSVCSLLNMVMGFTNGAIKGLSKKDS